MDEENFINIFKEEALELLETLEDNLLLLENNPEDEEIISAVFRVMHTIKGSAGMVGLNKISGFTHEVESILERLRSGDISVNKGFIDYTLKSRDIILTMINDPAYVVNDTEMFFTNFRKVLIEHNTKDEEKSKSITYRVLFKPEPNIFFTGTKPLMMVREVLELGEGIVIPFYDSIPKLSDMETEHCYIYWEIYITTTEPINKIHDIFIFVEGSSEIKIEKWDIGDSGKEKLGDILVKRGILQDTELKKALSEQHKLGEILVKDQLVSKHELSNALKAQNFINSNKVKKVENKVSETIRIKSSKLDSLIDLVGEIVTIYAQMLQLSHESNDNKLVSIIERFGMLTEELRDNSMSMRMLPIGSTFSRYIRLVRDLSGELSKKIELVTEGADTELDKNVIEQLHDPLVHIIRNSIDHGIENPDVRLKNGKKEAGTIKLSAIHSGSSVQIVIEDDGGGLSKDKIRIKAISKGIINKDDDLDDKELYNLIFAPGFSTAESITKVSGRGVGLDVVKRQIEQLKGSVYIDSKEGEYTKFTLILPITLAIIEGLLVNISDGFFVLPLSTVEACIELKSEDKDKKSGKNVVMFRNKLVPYVDLRKFLGIKDERKKIEQIVIVNSNHRQVGLLVDSVVGSNQTVIKSLGSMYNNIKEISGAAILGNGSVALVFDIDKLVRVVEKSEEVAVGI